MSSNMQVYISVEEREIAESFLRLYQPYAYQGTVENNKGVAKKAKKDMASKLTCRFCKKGRLETSFTQDTHLISKLLTRNNYYSHDECDTCNQLFKRFESDLAVYLGTSRVFNHISQSTAPGFESGDGKVKIKNYGNDFIYVENNSHDNDHFAIDLQQGIAEIHMHTQRFIPENVYRAILKVALGVLPAQDVESYGVGFDFLLHMEDHAEFEGFKQILVVESDLVVGMPYMKIFSKRTQEGLGDMPEHICCLYSGNLMFQIAIPCHHSTCTTNFQQLPVAPYVQLNTTETHDNIILSRRLERMNSRVPVVKDESIGFKFNIENLGFIQLGTDFKAALDEASKKKKRA